MSILAILYLRTTGRNIVRHKGQQNSKLMEVSRKHDVISKPKNVCLTTETKK